MIADTLYIRVQYLYLPVPLFNLCFECVEHVLVQFPVFTVRWFFVDWLVCVLKFCLFQFIVCSRRFYLVVHVDYQFVWSFMLITTFCSFLIFDSNSDSVFIIKWDHCHYHNLKHLSLYTDCMLYICLKSRNCTLSTVQCAVDTWPGRIWMSVSDIWII